MSVKARSLDIETIVLAPLHLKHGDRTNCSQCPVALALSGYFTRKVRSTFTKSVSNDVVYNHLPDLQMWIASYDAGRDVKPGKLIVNHTDRTIDYCA